MHPTRRDADVVAVARHRDVRHLPGGGGSGRGRLVLLRLDLGDDDRLGLGRGGQTRDGDRVGAAHVVAARRDDEPGTGRDRQCDEDDGEERKEERVAVEQHAVGRVVGLEARLEAESNRPAAADNWSGGVLGLSSPSLHHSITVMIHNVYFWLKPDLTPAQIEEERRAGKFARN